MCNGSGPFPFTITEIIGKQTPTGTCRGRGHILILSWSQQHGSQGACVCLNVLQHNGIRTQDQPPAHLALAVGTQARGGWICHARKGRGEWVLLLPAHCTLGMPCLSPVWHRALRRPFAALPAASLLLLCLCCFSLSLDCLHPSGCAGAYWDGGMGREGGNFHGNR